MSLEESTHALLQNVSRWERELSEGRARGTLLSGIAGKAANGFESLLRKCLVQLLASSGLTYNSELAPDFPGKTLQKLTLGEVVQSLDKLGRKASRKLGKDLNIRKAHKGRLAEITALRNLLHHNFDDGFAKDEGTFRANSNRLLLLIHEELSEPFFATLASCGSTL